MERIVAHFTAEFSYWGITLPPDDVAQRRRGKIIAWGWAIWYLFDRDDEGEYLDYYASHRMTSDRHTRIRTSGTIESLPANSSMIPISEDPRETERIRARAAELDQRATALRKEKGFVPEWW